MRDDAVQTLPLIPFGAHPALIGLSAQTGGLLQGERADGGVRTWLLFRDKRLLLIWPNDCVATWPKLTVLNHEGEIVARGGSPVQLAGAYLKSLDPRIVGFDGGFSVAAAPKSRVSVDRAKT